MALRKLAFFKSDDPNDLVLPADPVVYLMSHVSLKTLMDLQLVCRGLHIIAGSNAVWFFKYKTKYHSELKGDQCFEWFKRHYRCEKLSSKMHSFKATIEERTTPFIEAQNSVLSLPNVEENRADYNLLIGEISLYISHALRYKDDKSSSYREKAANLLSLSAEAGNAPAMLELYYDNYFALFDTGNYKPICSSEESLKWLTKAAQLNYAEAEFSLAKYFYRLYSSSRENKASNLRKSYRYLIKAAKHNHPDAACELGDAYAARNDIKDNYIARLPYTCLPYTTDEWKFYKLMGNLLDEPHTSGTFTFDWLESLMQASVEYADKNVYCAIRWLQSLHEHGSPSINVNKNPELASQYEARAKNEAANPACYERARFWYNQANENGSIQAKVKLKALDKLEAEIKKANVINRNAPSPYPSPPSET